MASTFPTPTLLTPKLSQPPLGPSRRNAAAAAAPWPHRGRISATTGGEAAAAAEAKARKEQRKRCLRCGALYLDEDNSAAACAFHGHITGEKGLFSLSPPHQGLDGEWGDQRGHRLPVERPWRQPQHRPCQLEGECPFIKEEYNRVKNRKMYNKHHGLKISVEKSRGVEPLLGLGFFPWD
uniref:Uncharacterized protein n=1 Tax=Aegilops tauschii TaxID=37682 RepID=N1R3Z0_AEGTA